MIDYLQDPDAFSQSRAYQLFFAFAFLRLLNILARSYYDLHVYNYFRFV
jgi:hypothetical protein